MRLVVGGALETCPHVWKATSVLSREKHADVGNGLVRVWYVRCQRCGQFGFTRGR